MVEETIVCSTSKGEADIGYVLNQIRSYKNQHNNCNTMISGNRIIMYCYSATCGGRKSYSVFFLKEILFQD